MVVGLSSLHWIQPPWQGTHLRMCWGPWYHGFIWICLLGGTQNHPSHGWQWLSIESHGDLGNRHFKKPSFDITYMLLCRLFLAVWWNLLLCFLRINAGKTYWRSQMIWKSWEVLSRSGYIEWKTAFIRPRHKDMNISFLLTLSYLDCGSTHENGQ